MPENAAALRRRLRQLGLTPTAIEAAWPKWWTPQAEESVSARADLRFSLARNLGLDPRTLFAQAEPPRFVWGEQARFKHLRAETGAERNAIASFGRAFGALLISGAHSA